VLDLAADLQDVDRLLVLGDVLVDAHDGLLAAVDLIGSGYLTFFFFFFFFFLIYSPPPPPHPPRGIGERT
jgi:hypothetical protein